MSKNPSDLPLSSRPLQPVSFAETDLPDAPPPSPKGRILYENLGVRIDRDGTWYYHGSPIHRKELVCLFASALRRHASGRYWLVTSAEMGPIDVEDVPFIIVELYCAGNGNDQRLSFRTNVDEIVPLDKDHPLIMDCRPALNETVPYIVVRPGLEGRLVRSVYYDLVARSVECEHQGSQRYGVWSFGSFFPLGTADATD